MSKPAGYAPGAFSWVDLMTPDVETARRYYGQLFGWSYTVDHDDSDGAYTQFTYHGMRVAGMGEMPREMQQAGMPSTWNSYISVERLEPVVARCQELGGTVTLPPMDIHSSGTLVGRMAVLADPAGAHFSLWQAGAHVGAELVNDPVSFAWNELLTRDVDASAHFYNQLFGWTIVAAEGDNPYYEIKVGERLNGGFLPWHADIGDVPPYWSVYFSVVDCDETLKRAQDLGGKHIAGPIDIDPGRFAVVADPFGAVFNIMKLHDPE